MCKISQNDEVDADDEEIGNRNPPINIEIHNIKDKKSNTEYYFHVNAITLEKLG